MQRRSTNDEAAELTGREFLRRYWLLLLCGFTGLAGGIALDVVAGSTPWLSIMGPILALIAGELIRLRRTKIDRNARRGHDDNVTGLPTGGMGGWGSGH